MQTASFDFCRGVIVACFGTLDSDVSGPAAQKLEKCAKEYSRQLQRAEANGRFRMSSETFWCNQIKEEFGFDNRDPFKAPDNRLRRAWNIIVDFMLGSPMDQAMASVERVL